MITLEQAKNKLDLLAPDLSPQSRGLFLSVLDGQKQISQRDTHYDTRAQEYIGWLEQRLASKHLRYLAEDQANGLWGQSTTDALALLARTYGLKFSGALDNQLLTAVLDGQKSPDVKQGKANTYEWLRDLVTGCGYRWDDGNGFVNLVGIRGYILPTGKVANVPDIYNDTIFVAYRDSSGSYAVPFVASTDPGRYYYAMRRLNPQGCAYLMPGQHEYIKGRHITQSSNYPALNPKNDGWVPVYRIDKSGSVNANAIKTQARWINIHAGTGGPTVYNASAGCQVIQSNGQSGWQWRKFWELISKAPNEIFCYTLLEDI